MKCAVVYPFTTTTFFERLLQSYQAPSSAPFMSIHILLSILTDTEANTKAPSVDPQSADQGMLQGMFASCSAMQYCRYVMAI